MKRDFKETLKHRRSYYSLGSDMLVSRAEIEEMVSFALRNVPSAFNSQSARVVLLLGKSHRLLWQMVKDVLESQLPPDVFARTEKKINDSFAAGCGTLLFFEDRVVVGELQSKFPLYEEKFPMWSQQSSGMLQLALWCMLEDVGFGASLQHYNPLIDKDVKREWDIPHSWELVAQMPFGYPLTLPADKSVEPVSDRMRVFD